MSLVADYGDSDSSSEDLLITSDNSPVPSECNELTDRIQEKLPKPDFIRSASNVSVFSNPFKEAENVKQAILEKHVKMVNVQDSLKTINGRKICWNYRKGRCRFGHNCMYAHDSDLQKSTEERALYQDQLYPPQTTQATIQQPTKKIVHGEKRKRPGLSQGLIPGKKVMKNYRKGKALN